MYINKKNTYIFIRSYSKSLFKSIRLFHNKMKSNRLRTTMGNNPMMQPMKYGGKKQKKK